MSKETRPIVREHNQATDEIVDREMTDAEFAQYQAYQAEEATKIVKEQAKEAAQSTLLARLGITEEEARLLLG